jgi:hypothetical protein
MMRRGAGIQIPKTDRAPETEQKFNSNNVIIITFEYIVLTLIIIIAEKEISIMARPPIDINKPIRFFHRILVLQSERDADLLNDGTKLLRTKSK